MLLNGDTFLEVINIWYLSGKSRDSPVDIFYGLPADTDLRRDSNIVYTDIWKSEFGLANKVKRNGWKEPVFKRLWSGSSSSFLLSVLFRTSSSIPLLVPPSVCLCIRQREFSVAVWTLFPGLTPGLPIDLSVSLSGLSRIFFQ